MSLPLDLKHKLSLPTGLRARRPTDERTTTTSPPALPAGITRQHTPPLHLPTLSTRLHLGLCNRADASCLTVGWNAIHQMVASSIITCSLERRTGRFLKMPPRPEAFLFLLNPNRRPLTIPISTTLSGLKGLRRRDEYFDDKSTKIYHFA